MKTRLLKKIRRHFKIKFTAHWVFITPLTFDAMQDVGYCESVINDGGHSQYVVTCCSRMFISEKKWLKWLNKKSAIWRKQNPIQFFILNDDQL